MNPSKRTKRRILTAGIGAAAFTAVEGLACGNPMEPRYDLTQPREMEKPATVAPVDASAADAAPDAAGAMPDASAPKTGP